VGPAPALPQASAVAGGWIEGPDRLPGALDLLSNKKLRFLFEIGLAREMALLRSGESAVSPARMEGSAQLKG
jgi:hypothetical protein